MKNVKKILVLALAALLLVAVSVAGTVAYLTATSNEVQNTFTAAELGVVLSETKTSDDKWEQPLLPGATYNKDPMVKLTEKSADAWVFVEIIETNNTLAAGSGKKVNCNIDTENWVQVLDDNDAPVTTNAEDSVGIWMYKKNALTASDTTGVYFLKEGTDQHGSVTVNTAVTTADMGENNLPSITFKAYALQSANLKIGTTDIDKDNAESNAYQMWLLAAPAPSTTAP